jgi:putative DNA methylase
VRQEIISKTGNGACANAIATYLAFAISKCSDYWNTIATWMPRGTVGHAFSKQAIPMTWDYPEANPFADFHCSWTEAVNWVAKVIEMAIIPTCDGEAVQADATLCTSNAPQVLFSTDPPYYSNIDYADLSDFFYVWLRRSLTTVYPSLFSTIATPKAPELVASPYRFDGDATKARQFFEEGLTKSFARMKAEQVEGYPTTVFYAFKQTESEDDNDTPSETNDEVVASTGWETMLEGLIRSGFLVDGTWPIRTERSARTMSIGMNALASSIVLVCRPRSVEAPLATRKDFITALRRELPDALRDLQHGNVAPVDLAQAAIGPGMAVFTRYFKVMETDGSAMTVRTSLGLINQALDEVLAEQEGEFDGDTRWALAWFEQFGMEEGPFGVAETLSKAKNTSVGGLVEAGFLRAQSGKVRLLRREELDAEWDPATDKRLTMWEITQYLIRKLEQEGESAAAVLVHKLGGMAEAARDLAYRLYSICERKKWATEALSYNGLVIAWPELTKLAIGERSKAPAKQSEMF